MLVSDKYKFIVAMPTKTGTNSLRAVVERYRKQGGSRKVATLLTGEAATRHRIAPPPGKEDYTRYMMVRDPYARLVSMYEYLRRKDWEWQASKLLEVEAARGRQRAWIWMLQNIEYVRSAEEYFKPGRRKAHGNRPFMWSDSLSEMFMFMRGFDVDGSRLSWPAQQVGVLRTEHLQDDWLRLMDHHGVDELELRRLAVTKRNATPDGAKLYGNTAAYWNSTGARIMAGVLKVGGDAQMFGYEVRQ